MACIVQKIKRNNAYLLFFVGYNFHEKFDCNLRVIEITFRKI